MSHSLLSTVGMPTGARGNISHQVGRQSSRTDDVAIYFVENYQDTYRVPGPKACPCFAVYLYIEHPSPKVIYPGIYHSYILRLKKSKTDLSQSNSRLPTLSV